MSLTEESTHDVEQDPSLVRSSLHFPVVGIGASAGGVQTLQRFFEQMPASSGMAFVIVLHLSPKHESSLDSILQRVTRMPVQQVLEPTRIQANHVYIIPPSKELSMTDGFLRITDLKRPEGRHTAIDLFFRSLAQVHRERALCLVLSGTGADGTQGLKRIKELGGVTIAQSPEDAEYDGMPRSAVASGMVDFVLPASEIPQKLIDLWRNAARLELPHPPTDLKVTPSLPAEAATAAEAALVAIKSLLRARSGHDFTHYKRSTVLRRLERRMQVTAVSTLPEYAVYLEETPAETEALLQDMLISVTNFFRDREAFEALERHLTARIGPGERDDPVRAWVAGCATGEEAYSIAILLSELVGLDARDTFQVFASDIDAKAIDTGRAGSYPESIITDVAPSRLTQFFVHEPDGYRITKAVRDRIVFSMHNALRDPPFMRLDLLCCRNLMIYLDREAQSQLLQIFHFALKPSGLLFLGSAETADAAQDLFKVVDKKNRIYVAIDTGKQARIPPTIPSTARPVMPDLSPQQPRTRPSDPMAQLHQRAIEECSPPSVLVDGDYEVLHASRRTSEFLRLPSGAPSHNLLKLVRKELRTELRAALFQASEQRQSVEARRVALTINGIRTFVTMSVHPVDAKLAPQCYLVVFSKAAMSLAGDALDNSGSGDPVAMALEAQVQRLSAQLAGSLGESATTTEELRASNEELQTINEELRSTTEELETSKEELQSTNEELVTVNAELNNKVSETGKVNDDLQNLIASTDIGTLFVDRGMRIKRYTPASTGLFNLIATDVGRPLMDITHRLHYPQLLADISSTIKSLAVVEREVRAGDGRYILIRILPYRTGEDRIDGAVVNFIDITRRREAEQQMRMSEQRLQLVADSMSDYAIITLDPEGLVTSWSKGAESLFGFTSAEMVGQSTAMIYTDNDVSASVPTDEIRRARETGRATDERWHRRKDGSTFYCSGIMTPLLEGGELLGYAKIARDLTDVKTADEMRQANLEAEKEVRAQLERASLLKDEFLAVMSHELKNPLNLIQVSAELLLRSPSAQHLPVVQRSGATIKRMVASQAQIIDDLLDLSRLNTGKLGVRPIAVELDALVGELAAALHDAAAAKKQKLTLTIPPNITVYADATRLEQIVWNLVSNAVKFTDQGGEIHVTASIHGHCARLAFKDTGIGLDPSTIAQVFDMFHQARRTLGRAQGGLGIGLAMVKRLAELQGGSVEVQSEGLGKGAQFTVMIPLFTGAASPVQPPPKSINGFAGLRILWVDDDQVALETLTELLTLERAEVTGASTAAQAMESAEQFVYDVILSDIAMPGRDGYDLIGELRRQNGTKSAVAVAVTGLGREGDRKRAIAAGFDAHLSKPIELETLLAAVNHVLARRY